MGLIKDTLPVNLTKSGVFDFWSVISVLLADGESGGVCANTSRDRTTDSAGEEPMLIPSTELKLKLRDKKCLTSGEGVL